MASSRRLIAELCSVGGDASFEFVLFTKDEQPQVRIRTSNAAEAGLSLSHCVEAGRLQLEVSGPIDPKRSAP